MVDVVGSRILMTLMESSQIRWASTCSMATHGQLHSASCSRTHCSAGGQSATAGMLPPSDSESEEDGAPAASKKGGQVIPAAGRADFSCLQLASGLSHGS